MTLSKFVPVESMEYFSYKSHTSSRRLQLTVEPHKIKKSFECNVTNTGTSCLSRLSSKLIVSVLNLVNFSREKYFITDKASYKFSVVKTVSAI